MYQEKLVRLCAFLGSHTGARIAKALYGIFDHIRILHRLRPGTADNASENKAAGRRLAEKIELRTSQRTNPLDVVPCACHVVNLAARAFLQVDAVLLPDEYTYLCLPDLPAVEVDDENGQMVAYYEFSRPADRLNPDDLTKDVQGHARKAFVDISSYSDGESDAEATSDQVAMSQWQGAVSAQSRLLARARSSPIKLVHELGVWVHDSPQRKRAFNNFHTKNKWTWDRNLYYRCRMCLHAGTPCTIPLSAH